MFKKEVPIPDIHGRITKKKVNGRIYVYYEFGRKYDKVRRFNLPQRALIGRATTDGKMIPNDNFRKYMSANLVPGEAARMRVSSCLRVGAFFVIRKIAEDYGFEAILRELFTANDVGLLLDLAAYSLVSENNAAQHYPGYTYNHPVFTVAMHRYSDSKVSSFFESISFEQIAGFLNRWNEGRDRNARIYISYDSTNKNCQAGDLEMVEYGKAKDDSRLPIFNYAIAFDSTNREPLFYEEYPGSIVDVSQLQYMLEKSQGYGYDNVGFILDRGYFSRGNVEYMDKLGYSFIMMVKGMNKLVSSLVASVKGTFETDRDCFIRGYKTYGTTVTGHLYETDTQDRYFHIFYSIAHEHRERDCVEDKIERLTRYLEKQENKAVSIPDIMRKYFELFFDKSGKVFLGANEKKDVIRRELELSGYFAIVTSEKMTASEALKLYKGRDSSEKLFCGDKSFLGNRSIRVGSDESATAKIFIEFIALIVRNKIHNYLSEAKVINEKKANYMNVPAAIRELEKIEMIRRADTVYTLDHAITATQKEILRAFGLNEDYIKEQAKMLSNQIYQIEMEEMEHEEE